MIDIKFSLCDDVFYFNTATCKVETGEIKGIQVVPTGISKDEKGKNKLDGFVVLYSLVDGPVLADSEVFGSKRECLDHYVKVIGDLRI